MLALCHRVSTSVIRCQSRLPFLTTVFWGRRLTPKNYIKRTVPIFFCRGYHCGHAQRLKFSITSDSIMVQAMKWAKDGQRVTLTYDEYKGKVLWRGNNKNIVTKIEPDTDLIKANPDKPVSTEPGTDK